MSAHSPEQHSDPALQPAGSPIGGRFAPTRRTESGVDLTLVDASAPTDADHTPSESDLADEQRPLPRWARGTSGWLDEQAGRDPDNEYVGSRLAEEMADRAEDRWFRSTRAGS